MEVPDSQVATLRTGSIDAFVAWVSYVFMVWLFKGVLMFLYNRLTCVVDSLQLFKTYANQGTEWVSGNTA